MKKIFLALVLLCIISKPCMAWPWTTKQVTIEQKNNNKVEKATSQSDEKEKTASRRTEASAVIIALIILYHLSNS